MKIHERGETGLQDGMLVYYWSQASRSDANVEARIEREPFDYREFQDALIRNRIETTGITPEWLQKRGNLNASG